MGRTDEQRERSHPLAEEPSDILGEGLESQPVAPEAWQAKGEAEAEGNSQNQIDWVQEEEARSYEAEQKLTALSLMWEHEYE